MKLASFLVVVLASTRLLGCSSDPSGTTVAGSVQLSRVSGDESGQTGFVFPDDTRLDAIPFQGSCAIEETPDGTLLTLLIERVDADARGLSSFALELPIETPIQAGSAKVTVAAGGDTFQDATGSCSVFWGRFSEEAGRIELSLDCAALAGGDETQSVSLLADLVLDGCH